MTVTNFSPGLARWRMLAEGGQRVTRLLGALTLGTLLLSACGGGNDSASAPVSVPLAPPPPPAQLTVASGPLPGGVLQQPYYVHQERCTPGQPNCQCIHHPLWDECYRKVAGFQLMATGGAEPYQWILATGSTLPPGLELQVTGRVDGTPTTVGEYDLTVSVSDSSMPPLAGDARLHISIVLPPPPQIAAVNLPSSVVHQPYSFAFTATTGPLPLSWSESGVLPPGIALSTDGVLSGTATSTGRYPISLMVRDSANQSAAPQSFTLDVAAHGFVRTGGMVGGRCFHTATLLNDGRVLLVGMQETAELYDPASGQFAVAPHWTVRTHHTATLLADGQVLVAGGDDSSGSLSDSAELYDSRRIRTPFIAVGDMSSARDSFTATLLGDGRVLVAGGGGVSGNQASAELFDPATRHFSATGSMSTPRAQHGATLLGSGKVLITGGVDSGGNPLASAELYDPSNGTFTPTGRMNDPRGSHTATLLRDGRVLITGGSAIASNVASAEIYDPVKASFLPTGSMATARGSYTATLLADGTVLIAGGTDEAGQALIAAELYDPRTGKFRHTGSLQSARQFHTATLLLSGKVLVSGGHDPASGILSSAELYE